MQKVDLNEGYTNPLKDFKFEANETAKEGKYTHSCGTISTVTIHTAIYSLIGCLKQYPSKEIEKEADHYSQCIFPTQDIGMNPFFRKLSRTLRE